METKKHGVQTEAHTKEQASGVHTHTHVLDNGTVVTHTHTHTHTHENTKAVLNRLSRAIGHLESIKKMVENGRDCSKSSDQQYRKSHSPGSYSALPGGCDRVRGYEGNRRIEQGN